MATATMELASREDMQRKFCAILSDAKASEGEKLRAKINLIEMEREQIAAKAIGVDGNLLVDAAIQLLKEEPKLAPCSVRSLVVAIQRACMCGFRIGGLRPEAHIVPIPVRAKRNGEWVTVRVDACCWPGYHGWVKLARNTGRMDQDPRVTCVYEGEDFSGDLIDGVLRVSHRGNLFNTHRKAGDDSKITFVWARWFIDGREIDVAMSREEIEAHAKQYSKKPQKGEWNWETKWKEMAEKTVLIHSVRRGKVPAELVDPAWRGGTDRGGALTVDTSVIDGEAVAVIEDETEDAEPQTALPQPVAEQARDSWGEYKAALARAETVKDVGAVYDAYFGPESAIAWTNEQLEASVTLFQSRKDEVRNK